MAGIAIVRDRRALRAAIHDWKQAGLTVGVVWDALWVAELPQEAHDLRVGFLATETAVRPTAP